MQSRSKENQIRTALMQRYILPLLLILGVRDGLGTPLTSSPGPTEAPSAPPDPCEGRPCLNGGVCSRVGEMEESPSTQMQTDYWAYACICGQGFTGQNCEFFADPCASSPCLHGNCSQNSEGDGFACECSEGYSGVRCDLPTLTFDLSESTWDLAESLVPEHATPATPATTTQVFQPTTVPATTQAPPTLEPWRPKPGQKAVEILWEDQQITDEAECVSTAGGESAGMMTVSMEVAEETAVKILPDALMSLLFDPVWFCVLHIGAPSGPEVTLRLHLNVKTNNCMEPGIGFSDPQCSGKGKCITQSSVDTFYCQCDDGYSGIYCEEFDACHLKPCENNGTCTDLRQRDEGQNYTCTCQPGFEGDRCQSLVDHCVSGPCRNGATCSSSLEGPHCYCAEGYQGAMCEQKIDLCASGPCHNNASCYPQGAGLGFSCTCPAGFTGPTCAQLVDFCALNPCAHGICRSIGTSYRCLCVPGYHGLYCEEEYNECLSAPCQNYATCRDLINAYECICAPQFTGKHCEIYKDPCLRLRCQNGGRCESGGRNASCVCPTGYTGENCEVDINECESNPCHHGGTCIDQSNGYTCHCPSGWVGGSCEIHLQWKMAQPVDSLTNMPRHSLYIIIGALCVAFVLMLIILIVGICRISRIEYQGSSRHTYQEFYNCRSIDSDFSNAIASIRHARFGKKSRPAMYDATPISYEDYSPDDKPLVTLIKTKDL
ncbi:delta and Notch-like epidermal growth factor-related receptor [Sinocyclocheilus anshuiensis]|uniref:delta and Notch-like epidermal growth factor-related receptor n=1 Tax=Sinocyclocheilus anshuiensis TaxID=1608454 RepID=UPI0007B9496C|nr:PREDICTED: delta and Notch-like epidermal growth factor-related receptor [Sinocyclocheilus anshuiensis]